MADTEVVWRGLSIGGGGDFHVEEVTGWDDLPDTESLSVPRTRGHGSHPGEQYARARVVTVTGSIASRTRRDELARALMDVTTIDSTIEEFTVETFGRRLRAFGTLIRRSLPVGDDYPSGRVPFSLQWRCDDPLRYGDELTASTGLPTSGGGLSYPLTYPLDYGTVSGTGQIVLSNSGTADAAIVFDVLGSLPSGFSASAGGLELRYVDEVPSRATVEIDTAEGTVLLEGTADRRGSLIADDWLVVPAADPRTGVPGSLTVQFASLGGAYDPAARLAARWSPAYW